LSTTSGAGDRHEMAKILTAKLIDLGAWRGFQMKACSLWLQAMHRCDFGRFLGRKRATRIFSVDPLTWNTTERHREEPRSPVVEHPGACHMLNCLLVPTPSPLEALFPVPHSKDQGSLLQEICKTVWAFWHSWHLLHLLESVSYRFY
jgi:hypothetical protein